jgi:hypothetical protein
LFYFVLIFSFIWSMATPIFFNIFTLLRKEKNIKERLRFISFLYFMPLDFVCYYYLESQAYYDLLVWRICKTKTKKWDSANFLN